MLKAVTYRTIAVLFIIFIFLTSMIFFPIAILIWLGTAFFDKRLQVLHLFTCFWASLYIWIFPPWRVNVSGRENIAYDETYIIVSNHQSFVDILVAFTLFLHFKWVSKAELFSLPFIGWNMQLNGYIRLKRGRQDSIRSMYRACEAHLNRGSSVYLFPEGTRSMTGKMRPFKEGAFVLAKRLNIPVLPIVINGSKDAVPKNSFNFHGRSNIKVEVLPAVLPDDRFSSDELKEYVREMIRVRVTEEMKDIDPVPGST